MADENTAPAADENNALDALDESAAEDTVALAEAPETSFGMDEGEGKGEGEGRADADSATQAITRAPQPELSDGLTTTLPSIDREIAPRKEVPGGNAYEIIYIARAGDPTAVEQSTQRVRELIEGSEGAVDNVRASETRRLAYPIRKQTEGVYVVINARFKQELTSELERFFKLEESVLRHMILREDE